MQLNVRIDSVEELAAIFGLIRGEALSDEQLAKLAQSIETRQVSVDALREATNAAPKP